MNKNMDDSANMLSKRHPDSSKLNALAATIILALSFVQGARAQTYTVLHTFTGGQDGGIPYAGLTWDGGANFYGTAAQGGYTGSICYNLGGGHADGCGTVFRLRRSGSNWAFSTLYEFRGGTLDGGFPLAPVTIARDGSLYGTTWGGHYNGSHLCRWIGVGAPDIGCGIVSQSPSSHHRLHNSAMQLDRDNKLGI